MTKKSSKRDKRSKNAQDIEGASVSRDDAHGDGEALRCDCGSLLARYVGGHIELKCRRCKRTVTVPIEKGDSDGD
jgi:hypothetical protein